MRRDKPNQDLAVRKVCHSREMGGDMRGVLNIKGSSSQTASGWFDYADGRSGQIAEYQLARNLKDSVLLDAQDTSGVADWEWRVAA